MKKLLLFLLLFVAAFSGLRAQVQPDSVGKNALRVQPETENKTMFRRKRSLHPPAQNLKLRSAGQIRNLKNGVLLVRLRTSEIAIKNLRKNGNEGMANTLQRRQDAANQRIMAAFMREFQFCPVYFFFSSDTEKVKAGKTSGFLLNDRLQVTNHLALPDTNFFVAELTDIESYRPDPEDLEESASAEVTFKALVVRDRKFHQLAKPFPFFVKAATNFPPKPRSELEMVALLNAKLQAYYLKNTAAKPAAR